MTELVNSVSSLTDIGGRVATLLQIVGLAGFVYLAYHAYRLRRAE